MTHNFILVADDYEALENKIQEIKSSYQVDYDTVQYNLKDESIYSLVDELTTISLFAEPKFVIAKGAEALLDKTDKPFLSLLGAMNQVDSENILVLVFMLSADTKFDYQNEQFVQLKRFSSLFEIKTKNIKLDEYAMKRLKEDGYVIDEHALALLISYMDSLSKLKVTIDLLESYCLETKKITTEIITQMVNEPLDDNVYALIDAVLTNNKQLMMKGYRDLKLKSIQASTLVSLLLNKFQEMYNVSILIKGRMSQEAIANLFHVSTGRAYYMIKNAKETSLNAITKHLRLLNELDYKIKTGKIDANLGLELYFLS